MGRRNGRTLWRCACDCGKETIVGYSSLLSGGTRSCGCLEKENLAFIQKNSANRVSASKDFPGSLNKHPLYGTWSSMLTRCYNQNSISYRNYGGRGIKVCDRWLPDNMGFQHFVDDVGERPSSNHTIDRIDVNGDYSPDNCRWATVDQQSNNRRDSVIVYYNGNRVPLTHVCTALGLNYSRVSHQIQKGFDINAIVEHGGIDFRRKGFSGNTEKYKNFNRNITIFVPQLNAGTELEEENVG